MPIETNNHSLSQTAPLASVIDVLIVEDERDIRECLTFLVNGTAGLFLQRQLSHDGRGAGQNRAKAS